jgi:uncharacterized DUF497 family protein
MGGDDDFEWDDGKEAVNQRKHGMSLALAAKLFATDLWVESEAKRSRSDRSRIVAVGRYEDRLLTCVYTWRGHKRRVISLRVASRRERRAYQEANR